jgi:hypothetical protein
MTELTPDNAPTGTVAKSTLGGYWIKTRNGWQASGRGSTFPLPGGGWDGELHLPGSPVAQAAEEEREVEAWVGVERAAAELYLSKEWRHYDLGKLTREEAVAIIVSAWTERGRRPREMWEAHGMNPSTQPTMTVSPQPNDPQWKDLDYSGSRPGDHECTGARGVQSCPDCDGRGSHGSPFRQPFTTCGTCEGKGTLGVQTPADANWSEWLLELTDVLSQLSYQDDELGRRAEGLGQSLPKLRATLGVRACPTCNGNDANAPCAFPEGGQSECLRDARIAGVKGPEHG